MDSFTVISISWLLAIMSYDSKILTSEHIYRNLEYIVEPEGNYANLHHLQRKLGVKAYL